MTTDPSISELVDDVAREMTAVHSMPPIRARVLARLETAPRRAPLPYFMWAAGVAAVLLLCVLVIPLRRPSTPQHAAATRSAPAAHVASASSVTDPGTAPAVAAVAAIERRTSRPSTPQETQESAAEREWRARRIAALEPIDGGAIQPGTLDVPLLSMVPVTTAPLVMTPLSSDDNDLE